MKVLSSTLLLALEAYHASSFIIHPESRRGQQSLYSSSSLHAGYFGDPGMPDQQPQVASVPFASMAGMGGAIQAMNNRRVERIDNAWEAMTSTKVQGGALRTWSLMRPGVERVRILMKTEGRPLNANIELWHGPDNTPQKLAVYLEDGNLRPFSAVIETPLDHNAVAIYNTGHLEFPLLASVEPEFRNGSGRTDFGAAMQSLSELSSAKTIQGGAIHSVPFSAAVESVAILLKTDGRPLNARIELLQGPNNNKQIMEVYTEDGLERPFYAVVETPGVGNVVRICNTATVEFPLVATIEPYLITTGAEEISSQYDREWDESARSFYFLGP